jgi:hypothetical protein
VLYQAMANHTAPECANTCRIPRSCCAHEYCTMAEEGSKEQWGIDLSPLRTDHPKLPYMGPNGCVVPPHLRSTCTLHTCQVNGIGFKPGDIPWSERYFELRRQIEDLESEITWPPSRGDRS